ncbi:MAG TPA: zf-HC2 domain-containing protein [Anaeromyxobacteraceae bacterium]|nr:zf-HC2 domain-containing protein [Anaeromyxobacteraceae bacterium]
MSIDPNIAAVMDCSEIERSVDAYLDGEFDTQERAETDAHLAVCPRCREWVGGRSAVRSALRASLRDAMGAATPAGRAPEALRARVRAALAHERRPLWRRALAPLPLGAVAAAAAGVLVVLATHGGVDALVDDAVRRHNSDPPLEVIAASVGPEAVLSWFDGKLDFRPVPPRFGGDARLVGGRLSHVREWPAAYMRYALPRGQAGLFIIDDPDGRFAPAGREVRVGPHLVRIVASRGYNVAVWRRNEIVYSLVSDLDEAALFQLVKAAER